MFLLCFYTLPCVLLPHLITMSLHLANLLCCSLLGLTVRRCALLFTFVPYYLLSHLVVRLCALLLTITFGYLPSHLMPLLFTFLFFRYNPPPTSCCFIALLFAFTPCYCAFYVSWYSFPILLCRWRSLEQQQEASSKRLR